MHGGQGGMSVAEASADSSTDIGAARLGAGGGFSILDNPFVLLGLPPTAVPAAIRQAVEDAIEDERHDVDLLRRAQQTLLTPRLRIEAEIGGLLEVDPQLAAQIIAELRAGTPRAAAARRLGRLHALPRSNVIAHYGAAAPLDADGLCELIEAQAMIAPGAVCDAINDLRETIALGRVDRDSVTEALARLLERQARAVMERLGCGSEAVDCFDRVVARVIGNGAPVAAEVAAQPTPAITAGADRAAIYRLEVFVRMYAQAAAPTLSQRAEAVTAACAEISNDPASDAAHPTLSSALAHWIALLRPVQTYEAFRQREDEAAGEMLGKVRAVALELCNTHGAFESAGRITAILSAIFGHLPRAAEQLAEDAKRLAALRLEQHAEHLLGPFALACDAALAAQPALEADLIRTGFWAGSTDSAKTLFDGFEAAVAATSGQQPLSDGPLSDGPWRLVRDLALELMSRSKEVTARRAAGRLLQGLLDAAQRQPPGDGMRDLLRNDHRVIRKYLVEADLVSTYQARQWKAAERLAIELLTLATDPKEIERTRKLRDHARSQKEGPLAVVLTVVIFVGFGLYWAAMAHPDVWKRVIAGVSPPSQSYPGEGETPAPGGPETQPPIGMSVYQQSRANVRYCAYQRARLRVAGELRDTAAVRLGYDVAMADLTRRCGAAVANDDLAAIEAELPAQQRRLADEGRGFADFWRRNLQSSRSP
jgi:hypothetical protein